jgi:hypothetical protein
MPPQRLAMRRKGESVTPAIGESTSGGEILRPAISNDSGYNIALVTTQSHGAKSSGAVNVRI